MPKFAIIRSIFFTIVILISSLSLPLQAQRLNFQHITLKDGLSQNTVYSILQDQKGFLWFGTQDGLNKFDGYKFSVINQDITNNDKLTDRQIKCLQKDEFGRIWIGTRNGGLNIYNPIYNTYFYFKFEEGVEQTIQNNNITAILRDKVNENIFWIGTLGGGFSKLWFKNEKQFYFEHFKHKSDEDNTLSNNNVTSLFQDKDGILWIGTDGGGLNKFNPITSNFTKYLYSSNKPCIKNITCLFQYEENKLWIGTLREGIVEFDTETEQCISYKNNPYNQNSLSDNKILCINKLEENGKLFLLIGTEGAGLNVFDLENNIFSHYKHESDNDNSIGHNNVNCIEIEKSGNLWIGTGAGVDIYDRNAYNFRLYRHIPGNKNSLSNEYIWDIYESADGMLWLATDYGLNRLDRKKKEYRYWIHDPKNPNSLSYNEVMSIYEDKFGYLWLGTWHGGLNRFDRRNNTFVHYKHDPKNPKSISDNNVRIIYEDPLYNGDILWLGTKDGGLNKFNLRTKTFTGYVHDPEDNNTISDNSVLSILRDSKGVLWAGTWGGGLNKFDEKNNRFIRYTYDPKDRNTLNQNTASMIFEDSDGNLWIGTHGGGLNKFDRKKETFTHLGVKDGLPNGVIYGILEDDLGYIWISTNKGLSRFNRNISGKDAFKNFDVSDGLQSNEFNNGAYYKSKSGEIFFGGVNGFNSFFPQSINVNRYLPPVVFTDFKIFYKSIEPTPNSVLDKSIAYTDQIVLDYDQSVFSIEFSALNYTHPEKNQYKYKLNGFDKDWTETDANRRFVTYTNLEPGEYEFQVMASNNDGFWNEKSALLKISILPPYWLSWWFRLAIITAIAGFILGWHTLRLNKVEKLNLKLEQEVTNRTKELENQKDELQLALNHVKQLSGLLPICASCKKIRDDKGYWNQIESYIAKHSEADFSHGICPDCYKELYPELANNRLKRKI